MSFKRAPVFAALTVIGGISSNSFANGIYALSTGTPNNSGMFATGISSDGQLLTGDGYDSSGNNLAVLVTGVTSGHPIVTLLPNPGDHLYSAGEGVTNVYGGEIVGYNAYSDNSTSAWSWTSTGGYQYFAPTSDGTSSRASAVSQNGQVIAGSNYDPTDGYTPWVWTQANGITTMPVSGGGFPILSSDGSTETGPTAGGPAFIWTQSGGETLMNTLPNTFNDDPGAIAANGSVIYGSATKNNQSFMYRYQNGTMTSLGAPTFTDPTTSGLAVMGTTANGSEVVGYQLYSDPNTFASTFTPWIWTAANGFESINTYLAAEGVTIPASWQLDTIFGISASGNVIYGNGLLNGVATAWVAVVPEPASIGIMGMAAMILLKRPRRIAIS